jgi:hypothetical protein
VARRACSSPFGIAPVWGVALSVAIAAFVLLFAPSTALAAVPAGLCDERGLSAIAPLPVLPLVNASLDRGLDAGDEGPQLCEVDATTGCRVEQGHPGAPSPQPAADLAPTLGAGLGVGLIKPPVAFCVRASWPAPEAALMPPGWRRRVEHPPRA